MRLQRHKHTHTCQKNGKRGCRFDYPKQPSPETRLKRNADGGNKARFYVIKREPGAEMVNPYNEHLLRAWRANMDVQVVGSVYGAALYVTHYICKDESQALKQVIAEQLASLQQDATVKQRLRKIGNTLLSHRQLSQQEAAFLVAGLHLSSSQLFLSANELDWSGHQTSCESLTMETQMSSCMDYLIVTLHDQLEHHLII